MTTETRLPRGSGLLLRTLGAVAPASAGRVAARLFLEPDRAAPEEWEEAVLISAHRRTIGAGAARLATFTWRERGPIALLVHDRGGRGSQLGAFVLPLLREGFGVAMVDLPAHGRSPAGSASLAETIAALRGFSRSLGGARVVVAHGHGAALAVLAAGADFDPDRAVLVAPTAAPRAEALRFAHRIALPTRSLPAYIAEIARRSGALHGPLDRCADAPAGFRTRTLVVHDAADPAVPWAEGATLAQALPDARLRTVRGLGHDRILEDEGVVETAVKFLAPAAAARPGDRPHTGQIDYPRVPLEA